MALTLRVTALIACTFVDVVTADADHDSDDEKNGNMTDGVIGMIKGLMQGCH